MNKYTKSIVISTFLMSLIVIPVFVNAQITNGGSDVIVPTSTSGGSVSVIPNAPATTNGGDDVVVPTSTSGGSVSAIPNAPTVTNGGDDLIVSLPAPIVPVASVTGGGGSTYSGGGSSGGYSNNVVLTLSTSTLPLLTNIANCLYINSYLKIDGNNDSAQVTKLQSFLKNTEKIDVDINGKFDQKTFDAVKAFQAKYVNDVMAPWGVTTPTGQVWYTTKKKINEIYCKSTFLLNHDQLSQIEAYKNGLTNINVEATGTDITATGTIPLIPEVGTNDNSSQTASVVSFGSRIWGFIKWLFGY